MKQIEWEVVTENNWHRWKHSVGSATYIAYVKECLWGDCRALADAPGAPKCKEEKWFKNIDEAKEWVMSELIKHAESVIDEAKKAQEFLDLVEGQTSTKHSTGNLPEFSDGANE